MEKRQNRQGPDKLPGLACFSLASSKAGIPSVNFDPFAKNLKLPPRHQDTKLKALILLLFFLVPWCLGGYEFGFCETINFHH
jgi:hypothetical protein